MLIFRRTIVFLQHLVSSLSLGDCSELPKESDYTRRCTNTVNCPSEDERNSARNMYRG